MLITWGISIAFQGAGCIESAVSLVHPVPPVDSTSCSLSDANWFQSSTGHAICHLVPSFRLWCTLRLAQHQPPTDAVCSVARPRPQAQPLVSSNWIGIHAHLDCDPLCTGKPRRPSNHLPDSTSNVYSVLLSPATTSAPKLTCTSHVCLRSLPHFAVTDRHTCLTPT